MRSLRRTKVVPIRVLNQCDCMVQGSPELIYRAIENIVRNAVRYTQEQSVVELKISCEERAGVRMVVLDVSDCGPGLPENELENIFRPFYRADDARQRDTGGFGVGLAIADRAVRLHHGEVRARNRPEGGLVVSLIIDRSEAEWRDLLWLAGPGQSPTRAASGASLRRRLK
jgi:signal transduction histidine kinase